MTPAAMSQQIRALEEFFGESLFVREPGRLEVTPFGKVLLPELEAAFLQIGRAIERASQPNEILRVAVAPAFAARYLAPRLSEFSEAHPTCSVDVCASYDLIRYDSHGIDVGVRYGRGDYPQLVSERLVEDEVLPVCAPGLAVAAKSGGAPDLHLLHDDSMTSDPSFPTWETWFARFAAGRPVPPGTRYSSAMDALCAAEQGAGVLLGRRSIVALSLARRTLVAPCAETIPVAHGFFLVYPPGALERTVTREFRDWLHGAFGETGETSNPHTTSATGPSRTH